MMTRISCLGAIFFELACFSLACAMPSGMAAEVVIDDLEKGTTDNWKWTVGDATVEIVSEGAKEAKSCLKITFGAKEGKTGLVQRYIEPTTTGFADFEKITFWAKGDGSTHAVKIFLTQKEGDNVDEYCTKEHYSFLDPVWHKVVIAKDEIERCFYSKSGSGKLVISRVVNIQFRDEAGTVPPGGCALWVDQMLFEGVTMESGPSTQAVVTPTLSRTDLPAPATNGPAFQKPTPSAKPARFLVNDFDAPAFGFNSYGKASCAIDPEIGNPGQSLGITFSGDGAVQFFVKSDAAKWAAAGCETLTFDFKGDGTPEDYFTVIATSAQGEWAWRGPTWDAGARIASSGKEWQSLTLKLEDFRHAWKKEGEPGKHLRVDQLTNIQFKGGKGKLWVDNIVMAPLGDVSALPLERVVATAAPAPTSAADAEWKNIDQEKIALTVHGDSRKTAILNGVWDFKPLQSGEELDCTKAVNTPTIATWDKIKVPSHWDDFQEFAYPQGWVNLHQAWYRRSFVIPEEYKDKRIHLRFSAIAYHAQVFLNGKRIGGHWGAWTPFELDATEVAKVGEQNELLVFVADLKFVLKGDYDLAAITGWGYLDYLKIQSTSVAWTVGECPKRRGIWQDVFLVGVDPVHVQDVFVKTSVRNKSLEAIVEVRNESGTPRKVAVSGEVRPSLPSHERGAWSYEATRPGAEKLVEFPAQELALEPGEVKTLRLATAWDNPRLWEPDDPALQYLVVSVKSDKNADVSETRFGFREVWIEKGDLILNGKPVHILGNTAHSGHTLSLINNRRYWETYLVACKRELNFNGTRLMSEVPYPVMPAVCDELGIMVIEQSSNWASNGFNANYLRAGDEYLKNLEVEYGEWIRRDRNHPSILIWCPQNEGSQADKFLYQLKKMKEVILAHDTTRPVEYDGLGKTKGIADLAALHYCWYESAKEWEKVKDMPIGCVEQTNKRISVGDAAYEKDKEFRGPVYRELLFSQSYQRMKGFFAVLNFSLSRPVPIFHPTFKGQQERPLAWDPAIELYPRPDHSTMWCYGGAQVNIWDKDKPRYVLEPSTAAAFKKGYSPLFAGILDEVHDFASGQRLKTSIHALNDTRKPQALDLKATLEVAGKISEVVSIPLQLDVGATKSVPVEITFPNVVDYTIATLRIALLKDGKEVFDIGYPFDLYPASSMTPPALDKTIALYDSKGETSKLLDSMKIAHTTADLSKLNPAIPLVIGKDSDRTALVASADAIAAYVKAGGRILVFEQKEGLDKWLPVNIPACYASSSRAEEPELYIKAPTAFGKEMASIDAPAHPAFAGLPDTSLFHWPAGEDGYVAGPRGFFRPYEYTITGNYRSLVSTSAEMKFDDAKVSEMMELSWGEGVVLFSQLELHANYGLNPVATKIVSNLLAYVASATPVLHAADRFLVVGAKATERAKERGFESASSDAFPQDLKNVDVVFVGAEAHGSLVEAAPRIKSFTAAGGMVVVELPAGPQDLSWVRQDLSAVDDNELFNRVRSRWSGGRDWWGEENKAIRVHDRWRMLQGVASEDLLPTKDSIKSLSVLAGLAETDIRLCDPLVMATIPSGKGAVVLSTLPILSADGYRPNLLWHTIMTNLGVPLRQAAPAAAASVGRSGAPVYKIVKAGEVAFDGDLQEWTFVKGEAGALNNWRNAEPMVITSKDVSDEQVKATGGDKDKSAVIYLMWDERYLYFGAKIIDDDLFDKGGSYSGDAVELCLGKTKFTFDVDGESFNLSGGEGEGIKIPKEAVQYAMKRVPNLGGSRGTELITTKSGESVEGAPGYVIEMALPLDYLPMIFPVKPESRFGLGVALDDNDGQDRKAQIAWPAGWRWNKLETWGVGELSE